MVLAGSAAFTEALVHHCDAAHNHRFQWQAGPTWPQRRVLPRRSVTITRMSRPLILIAAIFLVLSPLALYLLVGWLGLRHRSKCPACGMKAMRSAGFIRATILIDGKRAPDHWSYYLCEACGARFKDHRGAYSTPTDAEWEKETSKLWLA
jgi:hypothetical protein